MTYELAKKLKGAGFPQKGGLGSKYYSFISHPRMGIYSQYAVTTQIVSEAHFHEMPDYTYIPILEELIEACGGKFALLERVSEELWVADYHDKELNCHTVEGSTPSEAVANLWLILNEKRN